MVDSVTVAQPTRSAPLRGLQVEVIQGPDRGRQITAESDLLSVGSSEGNDLVLTDPTVSRYHAELRRVGDRIQVIDLSSTNGCFLGSARLSDAALAVGSVLVLGNTHLRLTDGQPFESDCLAEGRLGGLVGGSTEMRRLMAAIERIAPSEVSVLVIGETGTGKEVISETLHALSRRASGPVETVDCGTLQPALIASELFGHERGAFTGADHQHIGALERAAGGTLFLDEIGELPLQLQPMLLGALERRRIRRIGGKASIPIDVRVVAATHRDLRADVNAGNFRQDLYFRLAVSTLRVPALRERPGDIRALIEHFLKELGFDGPLSRFFPPEAMETLSKHRWPGNVRELRNLVEVTVALGERPTLEETPNGLGAEGHAGAAATLGISVPDLMRRPYSDAKAQLLAWFEREYVEEMLRVSEGNISEAARRACMTRSHLYSLVKRRTNR